MEGWVGLGYPAMHRPGSELATSRSRVRRPTTTLTEQPKIVNTRYLEKYFTDIHQTYTTVHHGTRVARLGDMAPIGLLLTAVWLPKIWLWCLHCYTFWLLFELADFGLLFASVWRHDLKKSGNPAWDCWGERFTFWGRKVRGQGHME